MELKEIYSPIKDEMSEIEKALEDGLKKTESGSVLGIIRHASVFGGKKLRPALVVLSAKAAADRESEKLDCQLAKIASAVELIHMASLIHDDVVDHSNVRRNRPTVNVKWGEDVAIVLGDYLYSIGFDLISSCNNPDVLSCISSATRLMCEGELIQVSGRDDIGLLKKQYIIIAKKKTASLFAASCQVGAIVSGCRKTVQEALGEYGLNLGISFQIVDDFLDIAGTAEELGKSPGADFMVGEMTLPVLNLFSHTKDRKALTRLLGQRDRKQAFEEIRERFLDSPALHETKKKASFYAKRAQEVLRRLRDSSFKDSLSTLPDYIIGRMER